MKKSAVLPAAFFALLALAVTLPLYLPGYILTLDQVVAPQVPVPLLSTPNIILLYLHYLSSQVLPSYIFPKIMLTSVFFLSGFSMFRLTRRFGMFPALFAGLLYSINPFVYERVMAGQWPLLLSYSLMPYVIEKSKDFLDKPDLKKAALLGIFAGLAVHIFLHYSLIIALFMILYIPQKLLTAKKKIPNIIKGLTLSAFIAFLINANWIIPALLGQSAVSGALKTFSVNDLIAFQSFPDGQYGLIFNLLSGYGFWGEVHDYFVSPKTIIPFWPLLSLFIITLSAFGLVKSVKTKKKDLPLIITLAVIFLIALDFAGGIALKPVEETIMSLYENVPFLKGFREPQKVVSLLFLVYAYFGSAGLMFTLKKLKNSYLQTALAILILFVPFIYTPTVFEGFWKQLRPVQYPHGWSRINNMLRSDNENFYVLFFPWHQYMKFAFNNNQVVANPAPLFFEKQVLSSRNYETQSLYSHDQRPEALHVEGLLNIEEKGVNLMGFAVSRKLDWGTDLAPIGVKYILLAREADWKKYRFLDESKSLEKIYEDGEVILYKNKAYSADFLNVPLEEEFVDNPFEATGSSQLEMHATESASPAF